MRTLHKIADNLIDLEFADDFSVEQISEEIQKLNMELEEKCESGIGLIQNWQAKADAAGAESKRLAQYKKSLENKIARIKEYYLGELSAIGKKKVLTNLGVMTVAKSGGKQPLKIDDEEKIPQDYKFTVWQIDKEKLRDDLENGTEIEGAHLEERGTYLKIS